MTPHSCTPGLCGPITRVWCFQCHREIARVRRAHAGEEQARHDRAVHPSADLRPTQKWGKA